MSPFLSTTMRRFSRSSSVRKDSNPQSPPTSFAQASGYGTSLHSAGHNNNSVAVTNPSSAASSTHRSYHAGTTGPTSVAAGNMGASSMPNGTVNDSRPMSSATDSSLDYHNRAMTNNPSMPPVPLLPVSAAPPSSHRPIGNLSRTDQIVLKHFWEYKFQENCKRDLHYLKFPFFPQLPSHKDLLPYCEIYHLVKTSPGANIISLGSANGVYIGFELQSGSQLHIDMDDEWHNISHHRVQFKPYETMVRDAQSDAVFKAWPKPLTIEFLEEQYQRWCLDLMSLCWEGKEVRELGGSDPTSHSNSSSTENNGNGMSSPNGMHAKREF